MATLQWDAPGDRAYEAGVSQAVLYLPDGSGIAWNGLTAIDEENNTTVESVYFDGIKMNDLVIVGEFTGTLRAFTYPDEFMPFDGYGEDQQGVYVANQAPGRFGLSYKTDAGTDLSELGQNYKIHVVYNLTANAAVRNWATLGLDMAPNEFEWQITAIPEEIDGHRPTAHVIFDSRKLDPWLMEDLESILYGDSENDANLPSLRALMTFIRKWDRMIIVDNGDGTWSAITQDDEVIVVDPDGSFELTAEDDQVNFLDADTYEISSSSKNDSDIFP